MEELASVEEDKPNNFFNDGKCDARGRLWVGTLALGTDSGEFPHQQGTLYNYAGGTVLPSDQKPYCWKPSLDHSQALILTLGSYG